jgi:HEPN domain-containing protein
MRVVTGSRITRRSTEYVSDFDIPIVTKHKNSAKQVKKSRELILSEPKDLNPAQRVEKSTEEFEHWFESASNFFLSYQDTFNRSNFKEAAFLLHQTTERFYAAILLVFTDYKPRIHDIEILGNQVVKQHAEFGTVLPMTNEEDKRLFLLLKKAYIDARYNRNYKIEKVELAYLGSRVVLPRDLTERICRERIAGFGDNDSLG